ncbi:F0F1 ATP synthase subunit C, partial [Staphylococcus aureus]|uniref:F0F1 ATP synthase subunit C n=1 Tax=Staphylococcus aureus TaxID=1280 RepID=UPI0011A72C6C
LSPLPPPIHNPLILSTTLQPLAPQPQPPPQLIPIMFIPVGLVDPLPIIRLLIPFITFAP